MAQILGSRFQFVCHVHVLSLISHLTDSVEEKSSSPKHNQSVHSFLYLYPCLGAVEVVQDKGFHLDLEDYLAGVLIMASELVSVVCCGFASVMKRLKQGFYSRELTGKVEFETLCHLSSVCLFLQSRLAVNSVTAGDYTRPIRISNFINELDSGFRLLNLKNDPLRKRYDGLKYDVKKIEEVVYDLSIRGLAKEAEPVS